MSLALRCCFLALLAVAAPLLRAGGLYTGEVPVASQAEDERANALRAALAQVFVKVSGDNAVTSKPSVAKAVANADHYVQQFQYSQQVVTDAGQPQVRLSLVAQFDRAAVDRGLGDTGAAPAAAGEAPVEVQSGTYRVWVGGIASAEDYARLVGSLRRNELVRGVQAEQARGDGVQLKIDAVASLQRLLDSLGNNVRVVNAKPPVEGIDAMLSVAPN